MIKLLWIVYRPELQTLEAVVSDHAGKRRRVSLRWMSKGATSVPHTWFESVKAEIENQDSEPPGGGFPL